MERPTAKFWNPRGTVKISALELNRFILKVVCVSEQALIGFNALLKFEVMIASNHQNALEVLTTEPIVEPIHLRGRPIKAVCAITTMNQDIAFEDSQCFMKFMRVADNYNFHVDTLYGMPPMLVARTGFHASPSTLRARLT